MAEENTGSGAAPTNITEDQSQNPFGAETSSDGDTGSSTVYNPDEGKWGPKPFGEFTPDTYKNGDPQGLKEGGGGVDPADPIAEVSQYMDQKELAFIQSLNPTQQGYFVNSLARIKGVYENQAQQVMEYEQQLEQAAAEIEPLKDMQDSIAPALAKNRHGFKDSQQYFESLVAADVAITENPTQGILDLMKYWGIKLNDLLYAAEDYTYKLNSPYYAKAQKLEKQKAQYENYIRQVEQENYNKEKEETLNNAAQQIQEFASQADEYGYLHPYFALVEAKMGELLEQTGNWDLEKLYEEACWLTPEVRNEILRNNGSQGYYQNGNVPSYQKFATSNSGGDSTYNPPSENDEFHDIFERNYKRFVGNTY
jgi:hypothetical protein